MLINYIIRNILIYILKLCNENYNISTDVNIVKTNSLHKSHKKKLIEKHDSNMHN